MEQIKRYQHLLNEIDAAYHDTALKLGLSDSAMLILYTVCISDGECLLSDITRLSGVSKQTVNSALRKLEADHIIFLESTGHKKKKVCLTETGKELVKNTVLKVIQIENKILDSWPKEDLALYFELTQRFLNDFIKETKELHP